jgi:aminopeptidase-like protein
VSLLDIVSALWPLHRTLVSDGTDAALELIGNALPSTVEWHIETYAPGTPAWTWTVPERYIVHEAYLEDDRGERIVDFAWSPLHLVSYSVPVDEWLSLEELRQHLFTAPSRPQAVPWEFMYYERGWGFCLSHDRLATLGDDRRYHAVIRSEFASDPENGFRVGVGVIHPEGGPDESAGEFLVCAHVCHPEQANDDAAGVASAIGIARLLSERPLPAGSMSVRFLFCPETIGSICYLSHNEDLIDRLRGGIFSEMTGNANSLILQRTRQDDHVLDRVARHVLTSSGRPFREDAFREVRGNDEIAINGPNVDVPCISLSRWPYPEYHTSDDDLSIISEEMLVEAAEVMTEMIRIYGRDYVTKATFRGPVFLSGHGLWVDWRVNPELNHALEKVMLLLDRDLSVFEIAERVGLPFDDVHAYIGRFKDAGFVEAVPLGSSRPS